MPATAEDLERVISDLQDNRCLYIENFLSIKTKDQRVILLRPNEAQIRLDNKIEEQRRANKPIRIIIVKPRQVGFSTYIQAVFFHQAAMWSNVNALTVAHDMDSSAELFGMSRLFYDRLDSGLRPMTRFSNRRELVFENPDNESRGRNPGLRSQLRVATANDPELGRSKTIHLLHRSERAFWQNQAESLLSVSQAVPDLPGTMIFDESTPNGVGDRFHQDYLAAKAGTTDFFPFFMAWFEHNEYRRPVLGNIQAFEDSLDDEERELRQAYGLDIHQLNWRRWAIPNKCGGDRDKFKQEYASNDIEGFLLSGRGRFNAKILQGLLNRCTDPITRGDLKPDGSRVKLEENPSGPLRIWKMPRAGTRYVVGCDCAEGLRPEGRDPDFSCAQVHDRDTFEHVASWHARLEPGQFGDQLAMLGKMYNDAFLAVEANGHGHTVCYRLTQLDYPNLYSRQDIDSRSGQKIKRWGWLTTPASKPRMIDALAEVLNDGAEIHDKDAISELMTYVVEEDGKTNATSGCHDDRVCASAIAAITRKVAGISRLLPALG
jgi:hypothetical protein